MSKSYIGKYFMLNNSGRQWLIYRNSPAFIEAFENHYHHEPFKAINEDTYPRVTGTTTEITGIVFCDGFTLKAGDCLLRDYRCLFTEESADKYLDEIEGYEDVIGEEMVDEDPIIYWVSTHYSTNSLHGPYTLEEAKKFAFSQKANASDGVKVKILSEVGEVSIEYKLNEI